MHRVCVEVRERGDGLLTLADRESETWGRSDYAAEKICSDFYPVKLRHHCSEDHGLIKIFMSLCSDMTASQNFLKITSNVAM